MKKEIKCCSTILCSPRVANAQEEGELITTVCSARVSTGPSASYFIMLFISPVLRLALRFRAVVGICDGGVQLYRAAGARDGNYP